MITLSCTPTVHFLFISRSHSYLRYLSLMVLILRNVAHDNGPVRHLIMSGSACVGTLTEVPSGPKKGWWHWSITGFHVQPLDLGPGTGMASSREEAMRDFAQRWRQWLAWAGLSEGREDVC